MTAPEGMTVPELMTVSDEEAVLFDGVRCIRVADLEPDTAYERYGVAWRTLPRPAGERLATVATVNDLHLGETVCGHLDGVDAGPELSVESGETPYPEVMNLGAIEDIASYEPDLVVAKGDLTASGTAAEWASFDQLYRGRFGERLMATRGNHDVVSGAVAPPPALAMAATQEATLPGVIVALLDTSIPGEGGGRVTSDQLDWLDELAARADRPVLVLGHHPLGGSTAVPRTGAALHAESGERLTALVGRRRRIVAYLAGHTHRNRVQRVAETGDVPWVEVACVKDFPGSWAEYRVFEGGILQVHRRIPSPDAVEWSERCRQLFSGYYPAYALGPIEERCLPIWARPS